MSFRSSLAPLRQRRSLNDPDANEKSAFNAPLTFISYSHKDKKYARALKRKLERIFIPEPDRPDSAPVNQHSKAVWNIYLDLEDARTGHSLTSELEQALDKSQNLVVLCSENSKDSETVTSEIAYFLRRSSRAHLVLLGNDYESCVPKIISDAGNSVALHAREVGAGEIAARLIARALALDPERVVRRHKKRQRRIQFTALAASLLAFALIAVLGGRYAFEQRSNRFLQNAEEAAPLIYRSELSSAKNLLREPVPITDAESELYNSYYLPLLYRMHLFHDVLITLPPGSLPTVHEGVVAYRDGDSIAFTDLETEQLLYSHPVAASSMQMVLPLLVNGAFVVQEFGGTTYVTPTPLIGEHFELFVSLGEQVLDEDSVDVSFLVPISTVVSYVDSNHIAFSVQVADDMILVRMPYEVGSRTELRYNEFVMECLFDPPKEPAALTARSCSRNDIQYWRVLFAPTEIDEDGMVGLQDSPMRTTRYLPESDNWVIESGLGSDSSVTIIGGANDIESTNGSNSSIGGSAWLSATKKDELTKVFPELTDFLRGTENLRYEQLTNQLGIVTKAFNAYVLVNLEDKVFYDVSGNSFYGKINDGRYLFRKNATNEIFSLDISDSSDIETQGIGHGESAYVLSERRGQIAIDGGDYVLIRDLDRNVNTNAVTIGDAGLTVYKDKVVAKRLDGNSLVFNTTSSIVKDSQISYGFFNSYVYEPESNLLVYDDESDLVVYDVIGQREARTSLYGDPRKILHVTTGENELYVVTRAGVYTVRVEENPFKVSVLDGPAAANKTEVLGVYFDEVLLTENDTLKRCSVRSIGKCVSLATLPAATYFDYLGFSNGLSSSRMAGQRRVFSLVDEELDEPLEVYCSPSGCFSDSHPAWPLISDQIGHTLNVAEVIGQQVLTSSFGTESESMAVFPKSLAWSLVDGEGQRSIMANGDEYIRSAMAVEGELLALILGKDKIESIELQSLNGKERYSGAVSRNIGECTSDVEKHEFGIIGFCRSGFFLVSAKEGEWRVEEYVLDGRPPRDIDVAVSEDELVVSSFSENWVRLYRRGVPEIVST